ncbi:MAG: YggS family pyridoxal phosphate-dependent enzyme [Thermodesulfobacteriota bacterium]
MAISVAENLIEVRKRLKKAARKAGRDLSEITIIAVTKSVEVKQIKEGIKEGLRVFGENYIQEAQEKIKKIGKKQKRWHFIGHLQKNKARFAVELFECIHSVDTPGLAREINRRAARPIDILIQVNITGEKTKHGATPDEAIEIARMMPALKNLKLRGLMAIPPAVDPPERSRPYFVTIRRLAERINRERIPGVIMHDLSMGMSSDFDIAIEEGATMVRVGTAIFGEREAVPKEKKTAKKAAGKAKPKAAAKKQPGSSAGAKAKKKPAEAKKAPRIVKATGAKKTAATVKGKAAAGKTTATKKSAAKATKKTAAKGKAPAVKKAAKALKAATAKKSPPKKKASAAAPKKKTTAAAAKTKAGAPAKAKKIAATKTTARKTAAVKKSAAGAARKPTAVKAVKTKKTAEAAAPGKAAVKKTKASKKKSK